MTVYDKLKEQIPDIEKYIKNDKIKLVPKEYETYDFLNTCDVLVTDYSSVFFDYAILNRPMYFYMFDLDEYASELRGFYFDIYETLPGPIVQNENDLLAQIKNSNFDYDRLKKFNQEFNEFHDGQCAKKVCDILFER